MHRIAWPLRFVAIILAGALLSTAVVLAIAPRLWHIANAHQELPVTLPEFQSLSQRSLVYDVADNVIAVFERENQQPIKIDQVPSGVIDALLAVEDSEFYFHHGVNLRGFLRALLSNFASDAPTQGASTITQQVVKNEFLAGLPRDGRYKALQAHYATMLEKEKSKDEILERYINTVFFGNNAYGLQAAAEVYFGKSASELSMVEGAFLAGLVRSPSSLDPITEPEVSQRRFEQVINRLVDVELMTPLRGEALIATWPIPDQVRSIATLTTVPTYYTVALRDYLLTKSNILGATEQERANLLYRGGLRIHTTLDPALQLVAESARNILPETPAHQFDAAVVSLDTTTGAIRAMVGGSGLRSDVAAGEINMALVPRQTGSSIKAFILAAAYQAGVQPNDEINGVRPCTVPDFRDGRQTTKTVNSGYGVLGPFNGPNTWRSTDCGFVRLSYAVGLHRVVDSVYRLSHSTYFYQGQPEGEHEPFLPLGLTATGNNAMSAMDMAAGMQTITNQGLHHDPYYVEYIDGPDGARSYTHADPGTQVLDVGVANATVQTLKGVIRKGTGARNLKNFSRPAAGKTGTQDDNTNAWFVGGTPQYTTAVWVGDPSGYTPMVGIPEFAAEMGRGGKVQGADYPSRIWGAYMEAAHTFLPELDWPDPPKNPRKSRRVYVPREECLAELVSGDIPGITIAEEYTTTTVAPPPPTEPPSTVVGDTTPINTTPPATAARPVVEILRNGTAVPPEVLDPRAPVPSIDPEKVFVYLCEKPPTDIDFIDEKP
ncbi:MAG: transglycosylase domain-containing protein [Actinobacteria bacterium]|nr:transglycosylase domain-containing protein [Actinomycetota bacterium]